MLFMLLLLQVMKVLVTIMRLLLMIHILMKVRHIVLSIFKSVNLMHDMCCLSCTFIDWVGQLSHAIQRMYVVFIFCPFYVSN